MKPDVTVVGAGVTGLTAAIEAVERGWQVRVAEAHAEAGGRGRTLKGLFKANVGPHAVYVDGPWWAWLKQRDLTPPVVTGPEDNLFRVAGQLVRWPDGLSQAISALPAQAPAEESFRRWLLKHIEATPAEMIIGLIFLATFDHDPGRLSASFALERLQRLLAGGARYIVGGWSSLISMLTERAASTGADIQTRRRIESLPAGPVILATSLGAARKVAGDESLTWPGTRVVTVDLALRSDASIRWFRIFDLDERIYAARYSVADPTLAPPGHELIQVATACPPGERKADAVERVGRLLDQCWPRWRTAVQWHRCTLRVDCTGAVDLPGTTWTDRPEIDRGGGLKVATDQSAAPGLFAETGIAAAILAVQQLDNEFSSDGGLSRGMPSAATPSEPI